MTAEERLVSTNTRPQEPTCANSRYRSRLAHFLVTRQGIHNKRFGEA